MKKITKVLALVLALALVMCFLGACGNKEDSSDASEAKETTSAAAETTQAVENTVSQGSDVKEEAEDDEYDGPKELTVGITGDPAWGVWASFTPGRRNTANLIYQTLLSQVTDPDTGDVTIYYVMMSGYEKISDDTYRVYLRDGIYDTLGYKFDAYDAAFSLQGAKDSGVVSGMNDMASVEVVDELTIDITMGATMAVGDFEELLTAPNMCTQQAYEEAGDGMVLNPIGTTGYVLTDYVSGTSATVTKADLEYWNAGATTLDEGYCYLYDTNVDTIYFKVIADDSTMAIALENGEIDVATSIAVEDLNQLFRDNDDYNIGYVPANLLYLIYNCSDSSDFENINLRKAVAYCFDNSDCLNAAYDGDGVVANAWGYPSQIGYQDSWDDLDYYSKNLDTAQEYLQAFYDETGKSASDIHIRILCRTESEEEKCAEVIMSEINSLFGSEVCELMQYETNSFDEMLSATDFDLCIYYGMVNKPYVLYNWNAIANAERRTSGLTFFGIDDPELQELISAAIGEDTFSDETVNAFEEYVTDNCYCLGLCTGYTYWVAANWVLDFSVGPKNACQINSMHYDWAAKDSWKG